MILTSYFKKGNIMKIKRTNQVDYTRDISQAGHIYTDGTDWVFYHENGRATAVPRELGEAIKNQNKELERALGVNDALLIDVKNMVEKVERHGTARGMAYKSEQVAQKELSRVKKELGNTLDYLAHEKMDKAELAGQVAELERRIDTASTPLNPEDIVELRGSCTVDELLRMREAGVL